MSIIILGVDMPESCGKCRMGDGYACYITDRVIQEEEWETRRASFCPLRPYEEWTEWDVTCDPEYRESHFKSEDGWG